MSKINPYQPPADELPEHVKSQLQADDEQARLRQTSAIPDVNFWLVSGTGTVLLFLANTVPNAIAIVMLFAWLGGSLRVCLVYSARARAALPPLNVYWLLATSTAVCFTLQFVALYIVYALFAGAQLLFQLRIAWRVVLLLGILVAILVYIILFLWSIRWAKQA